MQITQRLLLKKMSDDVYYKIPPLKLTAEEEDAFDEIDSKKSVERTNEAGKKVKNKYNGQIYTVVAVTDGGLVVTDSSKCTFLMTENDLVEVE